MGINKTLFQHKSRCFFEFGLIEYEVWHVFGHIYMQFTYELLWLFFTGFIPTIAISSGSMKIAKLKFCTVVDLVSTHYSAKFEPFEIPGAKVMRS